MQHSLQDSQGFYVRQRGRVEGPFSLSEIERSLDNGQIGMLSQIKVDDTWVSIREFFEKCPNNQENSQNEEAQSISKHLPLNPEDETEIVFPPMLKVNTPQNSPDKRTLSGLKIASIFAIFTVVLATCVTFGFKVLVKPRTEVTQVNSTNPTSSSSAALTTNTPATGSNSAILLPPDSRFPNQTNSNNTVSASSEALTTNTAASGSNSAILRPPDTMVSNAAPTSTEKAVLSPLPANEIRMYRLKDMTELIGSVFNVDDKGIVFKFATGKLSTRIKWESIDIETLTREPKVIEYLKAKERARKSEEARRAEQARRAEEARAAAIAEAERAKAAAEERARALTEYRKKQDRLIEQTIASMSWKLVSEGYLKGWGNEVKIGRVFQVVSSNTVRWSAAKLAANEEERYTHYLVESEWKNDSGQRVTVQFLVDADGSSFRLHGCFVNGTKLPDGPFLRSVKEIWEEKRK